MAYVRNESTVREHYRHCCFIVESFSVVGKAMIPRRDDESRFSRALLAAVAPEPHLTLAPSRRYLELQEMSKRLKKEQEERERRAFLLEIPSNLSRQATKPQPFRLHSGGEQRKAEVARRAEEEFEEKCTFRPETNAGRTKKFVEQVLRRTG